MKTAQVEREVKWTVNTLQCGRVLDEKCSLHAGLMSFLPREFDRPRREIHANRIPACLGEGDDICPRAAADVDGAAGFVMFDKFK